MDPKSKLSAISAAVRSAAVPEHEVERQRAGQVVVTLSRQAGIDAGALARTLAATLNDGGGRAWVSFDRELIEQVATEHKLPADLVATRDEHDEAWFEYMIHGLSSHDFGTGMALKIAETIRGLARRGHVIIVGRGAQAILAGEEHAVHVRLIAPEPWRIDAHAAATGEDHRAAAKSIHRIDGDRAHFIKAHFNHDPGDLMLYHAILNMGRLSTDAAVSGIAQLVLGVERGRSE
jgi:hypothetical protein